jgi:hypothetical protein
MWNVRSARPVLLDYARPLTMTSLIWKWNTDMSLSFCSSLSCTSELQKSDRAGKWFRECSQRCVKEARDSMLLLTRWGWFGIQNYHAKYRSMSRPLIAGTDGFSNRLTDMWMHEKAWRRIDSVCGCILPSFPGKENQVALCLDSPDIQIQQKIKNKYSS